jgi:preprotein translocase subunit Sec61beta
LRLLHHSCSTIGITGAAVAPVTAGLISYSQGGDLEDIGKAALTAYVAPQVGKFVGELLLLLLLALLCKTHCPLLLVVQQAEEPLL